MMPVLDLQVRRTNRHLLMAALVLLQIAMVSQRWIVLHIRILRVQSLFLAMIAATIAWYNPRAAHLHRCVLIDSQSDSGAILFERL